MREVKILMISASPDLTASVGAILLPPEFEVTVAGSVDEAMNMLSRSPTEFILFDFAQGEAAAVRAVSTGLPVMCLLPDEAPEAVDRVYTLGACDYVEVPIIRNLFMARLRSQLYLVRGEKALEKANDDLYDFCMPASHDLKAPFTTISTFMSVLQDELKETGNRNRNTDELVANIDVRSQEIKEIIEGHYRHAQAESCHRGGFIRGMVAASLG